IEAAGPGGRVTIRIISDSPQVGVEVCDSGSGPPSQVADILFEPFVTSKPEGVGLGLALARQSAVDHGGTLAGKHEAGQTVFRLLLPATDAVVDETMKSEIRNQKSEIALTHGTQPVGLGTH